ncbi:MAG: protoporphyrinogen oxidase, partial [Planctomycetales bacterium]|nr:protoporphyrinogen oxidase [Planctomycetales bacterium]
MKSTIAIIGGGISGLAAAMHLQHAQPEIRTIVLEANATIGGVLRTDRLDGFLVENAADSFLTTPASAVELCRQVGLEEDLIPTNPTFRRTFVVGRGKLLPIPNGFAVMAPTQIFPFMTSKILSLSGKLRAGCELFVPKNASDQDESVESFVCRRFGRELFERLVQPLIGSIYAADTSQLSIRATLPRFTDMEHAHRSLLAAMFKSAKQPGDKQSAGARYGQFASLQSGIGSLINAIEQQLPAGVVRKQSPVQRLTQLEDARWRLLIDGESPGSLDVDGVILAVPAYQAAELLKPIEAEAANELQQVTYSSTAVVTLGYQRSQIAHPLNGFGFVVPLVEDRCILSCSFSSVKFPNRAHDDQVLLRVFVGGECQRGFLDLSRDEIAELAIRELGSLLKIDGQPTLQHVVFHRRSTPQYNVGHLARAARIRQRLESFPSLTLACNGMGG